MSGEDLYQICFYCLAIFTNCTNIFFSFLFARGRSFIGFWKCSVSYFSYLDLNLRIGGYNVNNKIQTEFCLRSLNNFAVVISRTIHTYVHSWTHVKYEIFFLNNIKTPLFLGICQNSESGRKPPLILIIILAMFYHYIPLWWEWWPCGATHLYVNIIFF